MKSVRKHRPSPATVIALAAFVVALGGVAFAAIPDSSGTIHACYQKINGNLRVVEATNDCRTGENSLAWNQQQPSNTSGAAYLYVKRATVPFGQLTTVYDIPGLLEYKVKCEAGNPLGQYDTITYFVVNRSSAPLRVVGFPNGTIQPGGSASEAEPTSGAGNTDFMAFGANDDAASSDEGLIFLNDANATCEIVSQAVSNIAP